MCGLLAMFGDAFAEDFRAGLGALASRGPDAEGVWEDAEPPGCPVRLGHRRLSVIDLEGSAQPLALAAAHPLHGRYRLVYNGELYNFRELRAELEQLGHPFATDGDTEVLLAAFAQWGPDALPRLDGMFAFVVWDRRERRVFAARDRFGVKPLFYSRHGGGLTAASTLAPFFCFKGFPRRLNAQALREFLGYQFVHAPASILDGVSALPPGHTLEWAIGDDEVSVRPFWAVPAPAEAQPGFGAWVEATDAALRESVRRQLAADVPLGAFLSGGIDSSLMVHYMSEAAAGPVKTFSVRFPFGKGYDESGPAAAVAAAYGCEHHVLDAGELDAEFFAAAIADLDQPLADPAYLPTRSLSRLTREHVTVAVSGDGGDELFGGYRRYLDTEDRYPDTPGRRAIRGLVASRLLPRALSRRGLARRERMLWDRVKLGAFPGTRKDLARVLAPGVAAAVAADAHAADAWREGLNAFAEAGRATSDTLMRADLHTYLAENCLPKTDRASMAHGLEVRVPMLGNPAADAALPVHASVKLAHGPKSALTALAKRHLPGAVWDRPKHGFSVPLRAYFGGAWRERCEDWLRRGEALAPFLNMAEVRRRWRRGDDTRTLYTFVVLLAWLDTHDVDV